MQQPQVAHLILLGALACASEPVAPTPAHPRAEYRLAGRVTPEASDRPDAPPFKAGALMVQGCAQVRPCAAERWVSTASPDDPQAEPLHILRMGATVSVSDERWPARWDRITGALASCLPDPLAIPPAGDPAGYRLLQRDGDRWTWNLRLSGANPCALSGALELNARGPEIDPRGLTCEGLPWREGGQRRLRERVAATRRAFARAHWDELTEAQRAGMLIDLRADPLATELLHDLEARPLPPIPPSE